MSESSEKPSGVVVGFLKRILSPLTKTSYPEVLFSDSRPQKAGWAPGNYNCRCIACQVEFIGDKRATSCANCAYDVAPPPSVLPDDMTVGQYLADRLNRAKPSALTPTKMYAIKQLLAEGNDPLLLAIHYDVEFEPVAKMAEEHLVSVLGPCFVESSVLRPGEAIPVNPTYIPHSLREYLFFSAALETDATKERNKELGFAGRALRTLNKLSTAVKDGLTNSNGNTN